MNRAIAATMPLAAAIVAACSATPQQVADRHAATEREFASAIENRVPTKTEDCINPSLVDGPRIVGDRYVIYRESGRRLWVSDVAACPSLAPLNTLIVDLRGGQLCRNTLFRVLQPGTSIPSGYCRFGRFTAYERPDTAGE